MRFLESLLNVEIINETISFSDVSSNDINDVLPTKTSCKYYSLTIIHLGSKSENLEEFLPTTSTKIDIVAITETSEKEDLGFLQNIEIEGEEIFHTASKTSKGGLQFMETRCLTVERCDLF